MEVLEFEAGHMVGVFEEVLPRYGLSIAPHGFEPQVKDRLGVAAEDHYLGTFTVGGGTAARSAGDDVDLYVQAHGDRVAGLPGACTATGTAS